MKTITLFYVDDDDDDRNFFREAAQCLKIPVKLFNKGDELLRHIYNSAEVPQAILLDLNMPLKSGFDIIAELKQSAFSEIPLVVYSTSDDAVSVQKCKVLGASLYIQKVTSFTDLKTVIQFVADIDWPVYKAGKNPFLFIRRLSVNRITNAVNDINLRSGL